jgi:hypothetical protein
MRAVTQHQTTRLAVWTPFMDGASAPQRDNVGCQLIRDRPRGAWRPCRLGCAAALWTATHGPIAVNKSPLAWPIPRLLFGPNQVQVAHAQRDRNLVKRNDRRISSTLLQATDVLLAEPGNFGELLLRQSPFLPEPLDVLSNQSAHVHVQRSADYTL